MPLFNSESYCGVSNFTVQLEHVYALPPVKQKNIFRYIALSVCRLRGEKLCVYFKREFNYKNMKRIKT